MYLSTSISNYKRKKTKNSFIFSLYEKHELFVTYVFLRVASMGITERRPLPSALEVRPEWSQLWARSSWQPRTVTLVVDSPWGLHAYLPGYTAVTMSIELLGKNRRYWVLCLMNKDFWQKIRTRIILKYVFNLECYRLQWLNNLKSLT